MKKFVFVLIAVVMLFSSFSFAKAAGGIALPGGKNCSSGYTKLSPGENLSYIGIYPNGVKFAGFLKNISPMCISIDGQLFQQRGYIFTSSIEKDWGKYRSGTLLVGKWRSVSGYFIYYPVALP
jgi:hypothetical protein